MRLVCGWCGRDMGWMASIPAYAGRTSHGICQPCREVHDPLSPARGMGAPAGGRSLAT